MATKVTVKQMQEQLGKLSKLGIIDSVVLDKKLDAALDEFKVIVMAIDPSRVKPQGEEPEQIEAGNERMKVYDGVADFYNDRVYPLRPDPEDEVNDQSEDEEAAEVDAQSVPAKAAPKAARVSRGSLIDYPLGSIKPLKKGSKQDQFCVLLARKSGATEEELRAVADRDVRSGILRYDVNAPHGYGVKEKAAEGEKPNTYHLVFPEGEPKLSYK